MIKSINRELNEEGIKLYIEELDEREETLCFMAACATAARPCVGQACLIACIGATACLIGLHTI